MFILILMVITMTGTTTGISTGMPTGTTTGHIAIKTIPFSNEKHCELAAKKLTEKTDKDVKVLAVCVDRGLSH